MHSTDIRNPRAPSSRGPGPKIIVKKEPRSPDLPAPRHRPRRLDLSKNTAAGPSTARPLTSREALNVQEVGIACLSPGFVTKDPVMQEQLQRSMSVREQQRHIIESRLQQQQSAKGSGDVDKDKDTVGGFTAKTPGLSRRNKAPGLTIMTPSHEEFAHERVIQSAPLGQTFTGMHKPQPLSRHIKNQSSRISNTSHIHHVPATQTTNRLPPISDVFGRGLQAHPEPPSSRPALFSTSGASQAPLPSPGHPPPPPPRPRDYKSAEEAQVELAGGRPDLIPKLVHYGGHQPPTPPSPLLGGQNADGLRSARRRTRAEYEEGASPPLGSGPAPRRAHVEERRDIPDDMKKRKEEFMSLVSRAWDLFHAP